MPQAIHGSADTTSPRPIASPTSRKTTAVSRNAANSQTVSSASSDRSLMPTRRAWFPMSSPATTVAMIPDWPSRSATMYVPYAAATDSVSSTRWSSTAAISRDATQPLASPIAVLATMIVTTETTMPPGVTLPTTTWTAIVNTTSASRR